MQEKLAAVLKSGDLLKKALGEGAKVSAATPANWGAGKEEDEGAHAAMEHRALLSLAAAPPDHLPLPMSKEKPAARRAAVATPGHV